MATMGIYETKQAADAAEAEASRLHALVKAAGMASDASEGQRLNAETADIIMEIGQMRATHIHRDEMEAKVREFLQLGGNKLEQIESAVLDRVRSEGAETGSHVQSIAQEEIQPPLAWLDMQQDKMKQWLEEVRLKAWDEAIEGLRRLGT